MPQKKSEKAKKAKSYTEKSIQEAIIKIKSNEMTIRKASRTFRIPYSTLENRINKNVLSTGSGSATILSRATEELIVHALKFLADCGLGRTFKQVQAIVADYLKITKQTKLFKNGKPGRDWFNHFMNRWREELSIRKAELISSQRATCCTNETIDYFFTNLNKEIEKYKPSSRYIWNADETGFSADPGCGKIITKKGEKRPQKLTGNNQKAQFTVLNCCNAHGDYIAPFVVYKSKGRLYSSWCLNGPEKTVYATSESGWMENDLFAKWLEKSFVPEIKKLPGQHILIIDGHKTHLTIRAIEFCMKNNISLICLPAHSSQILQPLDVGVYNHVKVTWRAILREYYEESSFSNLEKEVFPSLLRKLFSSGRAFTRAHAYNGFEVTGIYPFDPQRVKRPLLSKILSEQNNSATCETNQVSPNTQTQIQNFVKNTSPEFLLEQAKSSLEMALKSHLRLNIVPKKKIKKRI